MTGDKILFFFLLKLLGRKGIASVLIKYLNIFVRHEYDKSVFGLIDGMYVAHKRRTIKIRYVKNVYRSRE